MARKKVLGGLLLLALVAGCGDGEGDGTTSVQKVIDHFEEETGQRLMSRDHKGFRFVALSFAPHSARDLSGQLGAFSIYVVRKGEDYDEVYRDLTKPTSGDYSTETTDGKEDSDGILWTKNCYRDGSCSWSATKRYGDNLIVVWTGGKEKETDPSWERLNAVMEGVAADD